MPDKCESQPVVFQPPPVMIQSRTVTVTRVPVRVMTVKYKTIIEVPNNFPDEVPNNFPDEVPNNFPDEVPNNDYLQYVFFTGIFMIFIPMILVLIFTTTNFLPYFVCFMKELGLETVETKVGKSWKTFEGNTPARNDTGDWKTISIMFPR